MTVEERLQRLEDDRAIRDLKARYLRACDTQDPDGVEATLLPDVIVEFEGFPPCSDREGFVSIYRQFGCAPGIFDIHHAANGVIEFDGSDKAIGQWSMTFYNINLSQNKLTQYGIEYDDVYVRRDGRWWIAKTKARKKSAVVQTVDKDGNAVVTSMGRSDARETVAED